jgi:hypothetical protein
MTTTTTAGDRKTFDFEGNIQEGVSLIFDTGVIELPSELFAAVLTEFQGRSVIGGFNMIEPPEGGLGAFVKNYSENTLSKSISARYASHLSAILRDEGLVELSKEGKATVVTFL